ncbi:MAG TPA: hypothetical protein VEK11_09150 [Thermoanaerobaculia bacterium]|nr:hypothetical protein [Thermoanaerobaculia bacterium]
MNTTRNELSGSDLAMPSGCEVETAAFHVPVESTALVPVESTTERSGMRAKLDHWKSSGRTKFHEMQHTVSNRTSVMKSSLQSSMTTAMTSMKSNVNSQMTKTQDSMRTSPMKWAGIAAGSGFAIGMLGRIVHWRNKHQRHMPDLVIIESSC